MTNLLIDHRTLTVMLRDWLRVHELTDRERYADQSWADYEDILDLAARIAEERFAPHNRLSDTDEPHLDGDTVVLRPEIGTALAALAQAGLVGPSITNELEGMQLPTVVALAASAYLQAANAATYAYAMLTSAAAGMLAAYASADHAQRWVPPMLEGRFFGTMCLSEPHAGSSLADIRTRAERQADGTYRLVGTKMWISGGEHGLAENILHLVLAKVAGGGAGVRGISLFVVPRTMVGDDGTLGERNDVSLAGINHKLGFRGTVNTVLGFGEGVYTPEGRSGAVGFLLGEEHRGLTYMFHMMNEARLAVGMCAAALGSTAHLKSVRYAAERPQGRALRDRDPRSTPVAIIEHPDVRRMLLAQKAYVEGGLALVLYCARVADDAETMADPQAREQSRLLLDVLTPIAKSWPSQWCLAANDLAIQIHGGYGYSREYDVEQHYRDNRLNPIHEGTHGIQALDLLGRKVRIADGRGFSELVERMQHTVARARSDGREVAQLAEKLSPYIDRLRMVTRTLNEEKDREAALANATLYMEATGHLVVAWLWLDFVLGLDPGAPKAFLAGKLQAAHFFYTHELPHVGPQLDLLAAGDRIVLDTDPSWL